MVKVITYGTFDLFHEGHRRILERAKALGDYLIVGVTTEHFDESRGKVNVRESTLERVEHVKETGLADLIIIEDHAGQKIEDIQKYDVDIFTLGSDWDGTYDYLNKFCKVIYLDRTPNVSSTDIRNHQFKLIRMGIVGTGRVAPRFLSEIKYVSGIEVVAAYNPNIESVKAFEKAHTVPAYYGPYYDFLDQVDAVYIASPNETHYAYAYGALDHGVHVLCEKPLSFTEKEATGLYKMADDRGLILLEAVKTAYCPGFIQLLNVARSGIIGEICDIEATFTRLANSDSRERTDANYGGSFLEYGSYTLLPTLKLLGTDYHDIKFNILKDSDGVDIYTKVYLEYDHGTGTAKNGVAVKSEGNLVISGTKGYILAPSPWWLTKRFEVRYEDPNKIDVYEPSFQGDGFRYEISEFVAKINGYGHKDYKLTTDEAVTMARITEVFMKERLKSTHQFGLSDEEHPL